ncbi:MAG: CAP domain-containing protein, partial [Anaerolineae bacterium]
MKKFLNLTCFIIFTISLLTSTQPVLAEEGVIGTPITNPNQSNPSLQYTGCGGKTVSPFNADYEQRVVELVNRERASRGLLQLKRSEGLTQAARYQAADMGQDNYEGHDTLDRVDGELDFVCGPWERIATYYSDASGENAAYGYSNPEAVMAGWMSSKGHKDNILNPSTQAIGVGYYEGSGDFKYYWVQDFGTQIDSYDTPVLGNLPNNLVFYYSIPDGRMYPDFQ